MRLSHSLWLVIFSKVSPKHSWSWKISFRATCGAIHFRRVSAMSSLWRPRFMVAGDAILDENRKDRRKQVAEELVNGSVEK